jgi:hypothetical protein
MQRNCAIFMMGILGFLTSAYGGPQKNAEELSWDKMMSAAQTYFASPTTENARKLYLVLPRTYPRSGDRSGRHTELIYYVYNNLGILERQVLKADRNAVKVAVRLFTIADGSFAEWLDDILGDLIRVDPKMFLEGIKEFPSRDKSGDLKVLLSYGYILCNGSIFSGESKASNEAKRSELELRIKALERVKDANLAVFRDECVSIIKLKLEKREYDMSGALRMGFSEFLRGWMLTDGASR